jgi:GntR family transcriptional regulator/MocR family aminotransferase
MPIQQRMQILQWARKVDGTVIEDDYDSELRYRTRPIPSLLSIDRHERVIYLGTFSKAFAPGLRMGYMVLPSRLLPTYHQIFESYK